MKGEKFDDGKIMAGLVLTGFANALEKVSEVGTFGASKYSPDGWKYVPGAYERYQNALYRHLLEDGKGVKVDAESNLDHLAHAAWNILALLELRYRYIPDNKDVPF